MPFDSEFYIFGLLLKQCLKIVQTWRFYRTLLKTLLCKFGDRVNVRKARNSYQLSFKRLVIERIQNHKNNEAKFPIQKTLLQLKITYDLIQNSWAMRKISSIIVPWDFLQTKALPVATVLSSTIFSLSATHCTRASSTRDAFLSYQCPTFRCFHRKST
jgi:hypothetical protein